MSTEEAIALIRNTELRHDQVARVSCKKRWFSRTPNHKWDVVAIDCGIKYSFIRQLNAKGCNVTIVPFDSTTEDILAFNPDGIFISNGPGDPADVASIGKVVEELRGKLPIFGIGLGHQIIATTYGAKNTKMKFGHRGANHPVKYLDNGKIEIVAQNHGYVVDKDSIKNGEISYYSVNDGSVEGIAYKADKAYSVQFEPTDEIIAEFLKGMEE
jgi:carbamoyl-phosphate synthase small subunit